MPLQDLSRECIHDTLMYKRDRSQWNDIRFRALYRATMQHLRTGQLAPYIEQKMLSGRYLKMQLDKRAASEIIVVIRGGHVDAVLSTNLYTKVMIADYSDRDTECELSVAEDRAVQPDMKFVYRRI